MSDIALYQADDGQTQLQVKLEQESVWLTQAQMGELFSNPISKTSKQAWIDF